MTRRELGVGKGEELARRNRDAKGVEEQACRYQEEEGRQDRK
jgi:hypothetical protein